MKKNSFDSSKLALQNASLKLNQILGELRNANTKVLLLLSGGSSLEILSQINTQSLSQNVMIAPLDERYSKEPTENNMALIMNTDFFKHVLDAGCYYIDTRVGESETQQSLQLRFEKALSEWLVQNPDGKIVATIGMGQDGHISGMMPYPESDEKFLNLFDDPDGHLVVAYDATGKNQYPLRVTTTMHMLRNIDYAVGYIVGEGKKDAMDKLFDRKGEVYVTPARILREIKGEVEIFTDIT